MMVYYIDDYPGRGIKVNGRKYLYFGGTSYLGLQADKEFQNLFISNIRKYGTNYSASRKSNVRLTVFKKAEALLSKIAGSETAITLSSGYLAGQLIAWNFNTPEYKPFYAPNTHSALYNNYNGPYPTFGALRYAIEKHIAKNSDIVPVLFIDSIDFEGCNYPEFNGLKDLPLDKIILIADDSHGIGIIGKNREGAFGTLKKFKPRELIVCCSLGKSFGIQAGAVLGSGKRIKQLGDTAFFGGASPPGPASMGTFIDGQAIYTSKWELLQSNIELFKKSVPDISYFKNVKGHSAYTFQDPKLTDFLEKRGFILTNFHYPKESASITSRIVISGHHIEKDIESLSKALVDFNPT